MDFLRYALIVLHLLGAAAILGPALDQLRSETKRITTAMLWGARAQILTGIALVGVASANDADLDHVKITVKLLLALVIVGLAESQRKKQAAWAFWTVFGLTLVNVIVAVFWH